MPIVNPTPAAPPLEQPTQVRTTAPAYKGVTVDSRYEPSAMLTTFVEGAPWTVEYYSQVVDQDSGSSGQQVNAPAPLQQYQLIKGLELRVSSPLTQSQNTEDASMIVQGTGMLPVGVIPNEGDMFLADIGDGKEGVFQLTMSEKKSIFKDAVYYIEYRLVSYSTPERLGDLKAKTIKVLRFVKDFLVHGQNPVIQEDAFQAAARLSRRFPRLLERWVKEHLNLEYMTLTVPGQDRPIYDPFLTRAVMAFFNTGDAIDMRKVRVLNVDDDLAMRSYCLWDAIEHQERGLLRQGFKKAGLVHAFTFSRNPMLEGIRFSGIRSVIYPTDPDFTVNMPEASRLKLLEPDNLDGDLVAAPTNVIELVDVISNLDLDTNELNPAAIKAVLCDDFYIFSQAFYDQATSGQTLLELCVQRYIDGKALDARVLDALSDSVPAWGLLERYYYIPILLVLIRAYIRGL
jgi:hypothetical protein